MLELPEVLNLSAQLRREFAGKTVQRALPPTKQHKFAWFCGDPAEYDQKIAGHALTAVEGFGSFVEILFDNGFKMNLNDGVNVRLANADELPGDYQLALCFTDGRALVFTVAMYGGIYLYVGESENEYYMKSKNALSPFSDEFCARYYELLAQSKKTLSAKAFLATEQRFPGIGNGVLQDMLFKAGIHPKRKISALDAGERAKLLSNLRSVLRDMIDKGGRDTERDIYGAPGGYKTLMSKNSIAAGCPACGGAITKEAYLGGSVYYCANCQKLS